LGEDVLRQAGSTTAILWIGINDIAAPDATAGKLISAYKEIIARMQGAGLRVLQGTVSPFKGFPGFAAAQEPRIEAVRQEVNEWIRTQSPADAILDFDRAVRDPANPDRLNPKYDDGEHLHLSPAGYKRIAETVRLRDLRLARCATR
jgi:lysophospholipase L1-like esterase